VYRRNDGVFAVVLEPFKFRNRHFECFVFQLFRLHVSCLFPVRYEFLDDLVPFEAKVRFGEVSFTRLIIKTLSFTNAKRAKYNEIVAFVEGFNDKRKQKDRYF